MLVSGVVATIGYNTIPFQAYIIVAALSALLLATLLTLINLKKNNALVDNYLLWNNYLLNKVLYGIFIKEGHIEL